MTLTLDIAPEVEAALTEKARRRGLALTAYLLDAALRDEAKEPGDAEKARLAAIEAVAGKYAHLSISSAGVRAEREHDRQREERFNGQFEKKAA